MADNRKCMVGVAFDAKIGGFYFDSRFISIKTNFFISSPKLELPSRFDFA